MSERSEFGKDAEKKAEQWVLKNRKSHLIARNFRCRWGEIDLIFEEEGSERDSFELVFVEVRACSWKNWLVGAETLDWKKQKKLTRTARLFLSQYRGRSTTVRFDLLAWDGKTWSHMQNLWMT